MLAFIPPQIPTASAEPPNGADWIHEIKLDGFCFDRIFRTVRDVYGQPSAGLFHPANGMNA
jgi:hypothetical protein